MNEKTSLKYLFIFSIPSIVSSLVEPIAGIVDTALVGQLNTQWLASLALCTMIFSSFTWVFNFLVHVSTQGVSKALTSGDDNLVVSKIKVSLVFSIVTGLVCTSILFLGKNLLFEFVGVTPLLKPDANIYYNIRLFAQPLVIIFITLLSILRGFSSVKESFWVVAISSIVNAFFSWIFLHVFKFGLAGVALGTVISQLLGLLLCLYYLCKQENIRKIFFKKSNLTGEWLVFGKHSLSIFGRSFSLTLCFFMSTKLAALLGVNSLAAHQIGIQIWLLSSYFIDGLAISGNILGARYFQKNDQLSFFKLSKNLIILGIGCGVTFSLILILFKSLIFPLFTYDPNVIVELDNIWVLIYGSQIILAIAYVLDGLLFGAAEFRYLCKHMLIGLVLIFCPLSYLCYSYKSLVYLWSGLIILGVYRSMSGLVKVKKVVNNGFQ